MAHWLDSWPALRVLEKRIPADLYNSIRVGLLRHHLPWSLPVGNIRCLEAILDEESWVCVDASNKNVPILAWTNFRNVRDSLSEPVVCELRLYHMHAGLLMGNALDALANTIASRARLATPEKFPVSALRS
ncbi:MAG: hypothetical protein P8X48_11180 [Acidiferrobacteraceae bacterium]|jgi:hypothetical protein